MPLVLLMYKIRSSRLSVTPLGRSIPSAIRIGLPPEGMF